ncbi:alpha/beta hydrolase [Catenuloplanes japonicus]|uniref:alpha/beta hydrolase n=1 Tax=Catenuloplanes japonicus TaxID=33876 RepID=UPI000689AC54|nr:alpha/beta hydrolase [Catenuloplanes japonicus]
MHYYVEPEGMSKGARDLASAAAELGPADEKQAAAGTASDADFGRLPGAAVAGAAVRSALAALQPFLHTESAQLERLSEDVHDAARRYRSADARTSQLYRELLAETDGVPRDGLGLAVTTLPAPNTDPHAVNDWWERRDADARERMVTTHPELIGGLDGVPVEVRDRANRVLLDRALAEHRLYRENPELDVMHGSTGKVAAMEAIQARLTAPGDRPPAYLLKIDPADDGQLIMSIGNPDTAPRTVTYVPGMTSDLATTPAMLERMDAVVAQAPPGTAATLWLGYDAPDGLGEVFRRSFAEAAAEPLSRFADGLRATGTVPGGSYNLLLAHSYGTTTYGVTSSTLGVDANAAYLVGSIGTTVQSGNAMLGTGDVNISTTRYDVAHGVGYVEYYNVDPSRIPFNAVVLPVGYIGDPVESHKIYLRDPQVIANISRLLSQRP